MTISKTAMAGIGAAALALAALGVAQARDMGPDRRDDGRGEWHHGRHDGGARMGALFDLLDVDGDDTVSLTEALRVPERMFARLDTNSDGFVSQEEFAAEGGSHAERLMARRFDRLDADNDLKLSRDEYEAQARSHFDVADADNDGKVTRAEFDEAMGAVQRFMHRFHGSHERRTEAAQVRQVR